MVTNMPILEVNNLSVTFHTKQKMVKAVNNVSLSIEEQDSVGIVGESGSGKSTLAMAILQLLPKRITQVEGEVLLEGKDLFKLTEDQLSKLRWKQMAVVFQKSMNSQSRS